MSVTIVTDTKNPELLTLADMEEGQAFLDSDNDVLIRTDRYAPDQADFILVMQLDTGALYGFEEDSKYQPVKVEAKIVT